MTNARQLASVARSYDAVADEYQARLGDELIAKPLDRALLTALAERAPSGRPMADIGCGPGHVAAWIARTGIRTVGIDASARMVEVGRRSHPDVEFRQGDLLALPAADGEFSAVIAFYSLIHLEPDELGSALAEIRRVLCRSGLLLVAFHVGSDVKRPGEWWGHEVDLSFRFFEAEAVITEMTTAGFELEMQLERVNYPSEVESRRAYLQAHRD